MVLSLSSVRASCLSALTVAFMDAHNPAVQQVTSAPPGEHHRHIGPSFQSSGLPLVRMFGYMCHWPQPECQ
jgi:hypothetical protein